MTVERRIIAPRYNSVYLAGWEDVIVPLDLDYGRIAASPVCVNIPCLYWNDGDTTVSLGPSSKVDPGRNPDFEGYLRTPDRSVRLFDANDPDIMHMSVASTRTRVRIWTNHPNEPDDIQIGLD